MEAMERQKNYEVKKENNEKRNMKSKIRNQMKNALDKIKEAEKSLELEKLKSQSNFEEIRRYRNKIKDFKTTEKEGEKANEFDK
jgi:phytoene/squalene synthetase